MYRFQTKLPRLPVPPLPQTLKSYLHHLEPLVPEEVFNQAKTDVAAFSTSEDAQVLHQYVVDHAAHPATENWLHQWWEDSYLQDRAAPGINVSPSLAIEPSTSSVVMSNQCLRAAILIHHTIHYRQSIIAEKQEPGKFKGKPFCMRDYAYAFSSCRVPQLGKDALVSFPLSTHIVVMCKGRVYRLEAFDLATGAVRSVQSFLDTLTWIKKDATAPGRVAAAQGMGALTCGERNQWANARAELLTFSPKNQHYLRHVEEAIAVLTLDVDANPKPLSSNMTKCLLGGAHTEKTSADTEKSGEAVVSKVPYVDRWNDKSFQVHVTANGCASCTFEHSGQDSLPALYWVTYVIKAEKTDLAAYEALQAVTEIDQKEVQEVVFDLPQSVAASRDLGLATLQNTLADLDIQGAKVRDFGADDIRKKLSCSPDAFTQMVLQVAFHQIRGTVGSTYESCATKTFLRGRTETIRTPTMVSKKFCEAYLEKKLSQKELGLQLRASMNEHGRYVKMCLDGQGCDRHLLGLSMAAQELGRPVPAFLQHQSFKTWSKIVLSTTHPLALEGCAGCAFGPVNQQCIGVAYQCFNNHIFLNVMTYNNGKGASALTDGPTSGEATKFGKIARKAVYDFYAMLEATAPPPKKPSKL